MSQEFEKIVLEKLNSMDKKLDEHTEILNEHTKTLDENTEQFKEVRKDIYQINNNIIKGVERMKDIEEVVEYNIKYIKKYHEENAKKVDVALKAYEQLNSKVDMCRCSINALRTKDFQNDVRITALEDAMKQKDLIA